MSARGRGSMLAHEVSKALGCPWFRVALMLACAIALAAAAESFICLETEREQQLGFGYGLGLEARNYLGLTREGSFGNWIVVSANAPLTASIFFYALPLLAAIPYAWSYRTEMTSGYSVHVGIRASRRDYIASKAFSSFATGFLVAAIPLLLNFFAVSCLFPAYAPRVEDVAYVGVFSFCFFSRLFYDMPLLYVAAYTLLDGCLMGVWAMVCLASSVIFRDRVKLMVLPYLALFAWHYLNIWIFDVLGLTGFNANLINDVRSESLALMPSLEATLVETLLLFLCSVAALAVIEREEVI